MGFLEQMDRALDFDKVSIPLTVLASFLFWFSLYCILCLTNSRRSYEWHCRTVTGIHGAVISAMGFIFGVYYNPWFITNPAGRNNNLEILTLVVCLGYFLFDLMWCVWFHEDTFMVIHHFLTIATIVTSLYLGVSGTEVGAAIFGSEASNPMLQIRYFLRETGRTKNLGYEINDLLFVLVFIFCRMGIGSYALFHYLQLPEPLLFFRIASSGLYVVSLIFLHGILRFAWRKYSRMYRALRAGRHIWATEKGDGVSENGVSEKHSEKVKANGHVDNHEHTD